MTTYRAWAEVDLAAVRENYKLICEYTKKKVIGVVKADAYGHGAPEVARTLESAGAELLAVACLDEAIELRGEGVTAPILVFGPTFEERMGDLVKYDLIQSVPSVTYGELLCKNVPEVPVHIKVDTGMGRLGVKSAEDVCKIAKMLKAEGIFTHLADSDNEDLTYTYEQIEKFKSIVNEAKNNNIIFKYTHVANSDAILRVREALDFDMVRPGIILYGASRNDKTVSLGLKPTMSFYTSVCAIQEIKAGESISYGRTYTADSDMKVAVLSVGYADGVPRSLSNKGKFYINGNHLPIVGRVCMDLCMVDITDHPEIKEGDVAEFFGSHIPVSQVANAAGTIPYEICTCISKRVPRMYINK